MTVVSRNVDSGGASYLQAANTGLQLTGEMTVSHWIKVDVIQGYSLARASQTPQRYCWGIHIDASSYGAFLGDNGFNATHVNGTIDPRPGHWDHVVFRVTGGTGMQMYVNGFLDGAATSSYALTTSVELLTFGGWGDHSNVMDGKLKDVAIWNAALNYEEISRLYTGFCPYYVRPGNIRGYWPLGESSSAEHDYSPYAAVAAATASQMDTAFTPLTARFTELPFATPAALVQASGGYTFEWESW